MQPSVLAWLRGSSQALHPDETAAAAATPVVTRLAGSQIVGLGEPNHGSHEVCAAGAVLVRALVEHHGFDVVALEASSDTCESVDEYVRGKVSELRPSLMNVGSWTWRTYELEALLTWLREFVQRSGRSVSFVGLDPQLPVRSVERLLHARSPGGVFAPVATAELEALRYLRVGDPVPGSVRSRAEQAARDLEAAPAVPAELLRAARRLTESLELSSGETDGRPAAARLAARDRIMAERALRLVQDPVPGLSMVIWAHNAHVSRATTAGGPSRWDPTCTVGWATATRRSA